LFSSWFSKKKIIPYDDFYSTWYRTRKSPPKQNLLYFVDIEKSPTNILSYKRRKFEPTMHVWLAVKDLTEKYQYPKSRIFTFRVNSTLSSQAILLKPVEMVKLHINLIEIYTKMNALFKYILNMFLACKQIDLCFFKLCEIF
jgi:hypothetical protein